MESLTAKTFYRNLSRRLGFWRAEMVLKKLVFRYIGVVNFGALIEAIDSMTVGDICFFDSKYTSTS